MFATRMKDAFNYHTLGRILIYEFSGGGECFLGNISYFMTITMG